MNREVMASASTHYEAPPYRPRPPPSLIRRMQRVLCSVFSLPPPHAYAQQRSGNKTTKIAKVKKDAYEGAGGRGGEGGGEDERGRGGAANWSMSRREGKLRPGRGEAEGELR